MDNQHEEQDLRALRALTNDALLENTRKLVENERRITTGVLHHLAEIERRRAYAKSGHSSLWDYAVDELKYSRDAAYRRTTAMRALRERPGLEDKIKAGVLSVSTVSQIQSFFRAEQNQANKVYSEAQKEEIFKKCENKSSREVTRELLEFSPLAIRVQKERAVSENRTVISFIADAALVGKIHRVRDLGAARLKNPASYPELVDFMSEVTLDEIDPLRRPAPKVVPIASNPASQAGQGRSIPQALRTQIWQKYGGRCAFTDPRTGKRCNATFGLEIEHCEPHAFGGSSTDPGNLRLLCRHHNQWQAIQSYGLAKMEPFLKQKK